MLPKIPLAQLPTPLEPLPRLGARLGGPELWVKRDDLTGLALGGNKVRKLEYLLAEAEALGADTVITAGGIQSNHCRLTAAAAARRGLRCELVLGAAAAPEEGAVPAGNWLLDRLFGARLHFVPKPGRNARMAELAGELEAAGRRPYVVPIGGSNGLGAAAYAAAMAELEGQLAAAGLAAGRVVVVVASSSGGTQAGLQLGARRSGFAGRVLGVSIDHAEEEDFPAEMAALANDAAGLLGWAETRLAGADFSLNCDYLGGGYGVVGGLEREAIRLAAREEGLALGPVYTARALGALVDLVRRGQLGRERDEEVVVFWHTGGAPELFAYGEDLEACWDS